MAVCDMTIDIFGRLAGRILSKNRADFKVGIIFDVLTKYSKSNGTFLTRELYLVTQYDLPLKNKITTVSCDVQLHRYIHAGTLVYLSRMVDKMCRKRTIPASWTLNLQMQTIRQIEKGLILKRDDVASNQCLYFLIAHSGNFLGS